jgi:hypothetical protein
MFKEDRLPLRRGLARSVLIAAMVAGLGQGSSVPQSLAQNMAQGPAPGLTQSPGPGADQNAGQTWPPLPTTGFVSGRAATDKDVADGNAVFALRAYGVAFGKPLDIVIPQYAYLIRNGQQKLPVIVVQAEDGKGIKIFGIRDFDGKTATAKQSELQLLGTHPPD